MRQRPSRQFAADLFAPPWLVPGDPFTGLVRADLASPTARGTTRVTRRRVPLTRTRVRAQPGPSRRQVGRGPIREST